VPIPKPPPSPQRDSGEEEMTRLLPYITAHPNYYLDYADKWVERLQAEGLGEIEIQVDFNVPYGVLILVEPDGTTREFELGDGEI